MQPLKIYDYLILTRRRVLEAVRSLSPPQQQRAFDFGLAGGIVPTLAHLMTSEWYYIERLEGRDVPPYEQWPLRYDLPHTPSFSIIDATWPTQWTRIRASVASERDWLRSITWLSFPDDTRNNQRFHITCTAGDLFTQLALHEMHHRAQVLAMLRIIGVSIVEDIDYNALMYQRTPEAKPAQAETE